MAYEVKLLDCVVSRRSTRSREGNPAAARALQEISNKKKAQLEKREREERAAAETTAGTSKVWQHTKKRRCRTKASLEAKTASGARESSNEIRVGGYFNPLLPSYADAVRMPSSPSRPAASAATASTSPLRPRTASSSISNVKSKKKKRSRSQAQAPSPSSSPVKKSLKTKNRRDSSIAPKIVRRSSNGSHRPHHCRVHAPLVPAPGTTAGVEPALTRASALGRPAAPAAPADASKSAEGQSTGDEVTYDAAGFVDFTDDPSKFPPSLTAAVDALKALHMIMIERAAAGDEHLAPCISTTYAAPFWSSARMGTCAGHFPPEDAIGSRSIVTLRTAQSGKWAGSLQAANPCQRIFNHLLHRTSELITTATEARYVAMDGTESTTQLSPEAVWLLSNDFCDLFPALTASHLGSRVARATVKSLGTEFMVELIYAFASVLKERAKYLAECRGVESGAATIMVWGAGTSDGTKFNGVLRDVSTCLTNMGIAHAKMRHPEAILRGNAVAKLGAEFDDKEISAFLSACRLDDISGNATSTFLGVENITDADRSLLTEVMRQIGKSVMRKPGKVGSEKRQVYDALVASCEVQETESEQEKRGKHLRCCKIAQVCVSLFGTLISAGIVAKGDSVTKKLQKLASTDLSTVLKRLKIDGKNAEAYESVLRLTKKNVKAESSKAEPLSSWMDVYSRILARALGLADEDAEKMTLKELLDAHASKMRGEGATHASISVEGVAEAAGMDVSEARNMEYVRVLDLATQQRHGSGVTYSVAKRAGMLAAVGVSDKDAKVIGSVAATQRTAHRLALARSLGVDLAANSSQKTKMGLLAEEFDALGADEKMAITMTVESLDMAELFDLDPDEAFELRQSMSLANMDPSSTLNQIVRAFEASLSETKDRNRPVAELLAANEGGEKLTGSFIESLSVHRYHEAHLARKSAFTLAEIREMSLGAFKRHYNDLMWPVYEVDVERYRDEGRWVDHTDARFAHLRILIEQSRNGLQRGLPADWAENFAMVSTQKAHQVELRLYVRKAETWQMAKRIGNIIPSTKKGPWRKCLRFTAVSGDRQKIEVVEAHFPHLRPFDPTLHLAVDAHAATSAWSTRHLPQRCVEEWEREGTWITIAEAGHDFLDYLLNDPRADELPDDWEERVRFHRYGNNSATDPTTSVYLDVYVDRRPAGETTSVWFGVRRAQDAHKTQQVPRYQLAFLKAHFYQSAFEARPLSQQMKICELGHWYEEYMFDKEVSPLDVLFYQHEHRWLTHDVSRTRTASRGDSFDGFEKISLHLARFDPSIREADWRDSFAFVRVPRADRPNTWRSFMCVFHRGKWRECGVRTSAKKHRDASLMPNQNHKMSWFQRGEFVRLWFDSARG